MCSLEKRGNLFILTLTGPTNKDPHALNPTLIASIRSSLSQAKCQATNGSVLITLATGRFFSNGFDLLHAQSVGSRPGSKPGSDVNELQHMVELFKGVVADFLSLPMPTIAAVTGHAAAAGMMLAISHDYVVMNSNRSVMYMSELDIGMTLPDYFMALIRAKAKCAMDGRDLLLKAKKVKAEEAVGMGFVDAVKGGAEEVVEAAVKMGEEMGNRGWDGNVYREIRKSLYPELCGLLGLKIQSVVPSKLEKAFLILSGRREHGLFR